MADNIRHIFVSDTISVALQDAVSALDAWEKRRKKPDVFSRIFKKSWHRDHNRWSYVLRTFHRRDDRYRELIFDAETGIVLRDIEEPLSQHRARGSARTPLESKEISPFPFIKARFVTCDTSLATQPGNVRLNRAS